MRFFRSICLFFLYPFLLFLSGFWMGAYFYRFFYPGDTSWNVSKHQEVSTDPNRLCADTELVLMEEDLNNHTCVETVWQLPEKYIGMNRDSFLDAMETYELSPPLSEQERGFVGLEVLSFSEDKVTVQKNYSPEVSNPVFFLAVEDHEVVVYLEDKKTIYFHTGILLQDFPDDVQLQIIDMYRVESEDELYDFLETYSS